MVVEYKAARDGTDERFVGKESAGNRITIIRMLGSTLLAAVAMAMAVQMSQSPNLYVATTMFGAIGGAIGISARGAEGLFFGSLSGTCIFLSLAWGAHF